MSQQYSYLAVVSQLRHKLKHVVKCFEVGYYLVAHRATMTVNFLETKNAQAVRHTSVDHICYIMCRDTFKVFLPRQSCQCRFGINMSAELAVMSRTFALLVASPDFDESEKERK